MGYNDMIDNYQPFISERQLIDEVSETLYYIGSCRTFCEPNQPKWKIQKIFKDGSVWKFQFPNGKQTYDFIWDDRGTYTYK